MTSQNAQASTRKPIVLGPGEGRRIPGPEGITLKATGEETLGSIGFVEAWSEPGFAAPRHIHHECDELFYVLEGEFQFLVGSEIVSASAGSFVFIPRGTVHAPKVVSDSPAKVVFAFVPGGAEAAFEEMAKLGPGHGADGLPDMEKLQEIARRSASEFVGPPI